ncbi:hypothetical protein M153_4790005115 [Pseudoloma neurophilia]|uniref:Uncharacterized protein n=1 Tax=Pseudoloma neurophilia TaxID=146866 RepID=A0A0R0M390_9MICR|nr:hypothetical protein M153_4790005115 [Pseudoloma neurophilia]
MKVPTHQINSDFFVDSFFVLQNNINKLYLRIKSFFISIYI